MEGRVSNQDTQRAAVWRCASGISVMQWVLRRCVISWLLCVPCILVLAHTVWGHQGIGIAWGCEEPWAQHRSNLMCIGVKDGWCCVVWRLVLGYEGVKQHKGL